MLHDKWEEITNPLFVVNVWEAVYKDLFKYILITTDLKYDDLINLYLSSKSLKRKFDSIPKIWYELFKRDFDYFSNISWNETKEETQFFKKLYMKCVKIVTKTNNKQKEKEKEKGKEILKTFIIEKNFDTFVYLYMGIKEEREQKERTLNNCLSDTCTKYDSVDILYYLLPKVNINYIDAKRCIKYKSINSFRKLLEDGRLGSHDLYFILKNHSHKKKFVRELITNKSVDVTKDNHFLLRHAVWDNLYNVVKLLIEARHLTDNLDPSFDDNYCIIVAAQEGYRNIVKVLLKSSFVVKKLKNLKN